MIFTSKMQTILISDDSDYDNSFLNEPKVSVPEYDFCADTLLTANGDVGVDWADFHLNSTARYFDNITVMETFYLTVPNHRITDSPLLL